MGFLDSAINKTKSVAQQSKNSVNSSIEQSKIKDKINKEKSKVKYIYVDIGKEYYRYTQDKDDSHIDTMDKKAAEVDECRKLIEQYEAELEESKVKSQERKEAIRAEEDAKSKEIDAADSEKRQQKREEEDLF